MEPTAHAASSGVCNDVTTLPVDFQAYTEFGDKDSAELVSDQWIYVFKRHSWGTSLNAEIFAGADGTLKLVNWKNEHWPAKDERTADVETKSYALFEVDYQPGKHDLFFFLSQVQLARTRIAAYTGHSGLETVARRGMLFDPADSDHVQPLGDNCTGCTVYLTDHLRIAKERHKLYKKALDQQANFLEDEQDSTRKMLAAMTVNVAESIAEKEEDVLSWFDKEKAQQEVEDYESKRNEHEGNVQVGADYLCSWMEQAAYREVLFDYTGTEALADKGHDVQADLSRGLSQSEPGHKHLDKMLNDKDSWHNKVVVPKGEYLFGQATHAVGASEKALELFQEFAVSMSGRSLKQTASLTQSFFKMRYDARVSFFKTVRGKGRGLQKIEVTYSQFMEGRAVTRGLDADATLGRLKKTAAAAKTSLEHLGAVLSIVNLALTSKSAAEAKGTEEQALAVMKLVAAVADVSKTVAGWTASISEEGMEKIGGVVSIVGGVTSYSTSVWELSTRSPDMNNGVVVGLSLSALGGAFTAAEGVSVLTESLLLGVGSTGIGLIAIGLAAAGAAAVYYFKETRLEKWFKQCPWGIEAKSRPARRHLEDLFKILAEFEVRCDVLISMPAQAKAPGSDTYSYEYTVRFRIAPGLYYPKRSVFKIDRLNIGGHITGHFTIEDPANHKRLLDKYDDGSLLRIEQSNGRIEEIRRTWRREDPAPPAYAFNVTLDVMGDGKFEITKKGKGNLEAIKSWEQ